jgi:hypothetical protein
LLPSFLSRLLIRLHAHDKAIKEYALEQQRAGNDSDDEEENANENKAPLGGRRSAVRGYQSRETNRYSSPTRYHSISPSISLNLTQPPSLSPSFCVVLYAIKLNSIRLNLTQSDSIRLNPTQSDSIRLNPTRNNSKQLETTRHNPQAIIHPETVHSWIAARHVCPQHC